MAKTLRSAAKQLSDQLRNIRRRFEREAARASKRASTATGAEAARWKATAAEYLAKAEEYRAPIGVKRGSAEYTEQVKRAVHRGTRESASVIGSTSARNKLAKTLLQGNVASQFLAATKELWYRPGETGVNQIPRDEYYKRIMRGLGARDLMEAIEKLEAGTGVSFTDPEDAIGGINERYNDVYVRAGMLFVQTL